MNYAWSVEHYPGGKGGQPPPYEIIEVPKEEPDPEEEDE